MSPNKRTLLVSLGGAVGGAAIVLINPNPKFFSSLFDRTLITRWPWLGAASGWMAFSLYWEVAAKNAAKAKSTESRASRGLHVLLANTALVLAMAPLRGAGRFVPAASAVMIAGLAVEALGLYLAILSRHYLGCNWSGEISIKVDHQLIRSGPYKTLRHPIYTGLLTMYAGTALVTGTWVALAGLAMAAVAYWRKIRLEEANLEVAFGADYEAYRRESWALVPGVL